MSYKKEKAPFSLSNDKPDDAPYFASRADFALVSLTTLNQFEDGAEVTPEVLVANGVIKNVKSGVKVLATGKLEKKLTVKANKFSASAVKVIEAAGGTTEVI